MMAYQSEIQLNTLEMLYLFKNSFIEKSAKEIYGEILGEGNPKKRESKIRETREVKTKLKTREETKENKETKTSEVAMTDAVTLIKRGLLKHATAQS